MDGDGGGWRPTEPFTVYSDGRERGHDRGLIKHLASYPWLVGHGKTMANCFGCM